MTFESLRLTLFCLEKHIVRKALFLCSRGVFSAVCTQVTACLDLGGCWLSEVNIAIMDGQGLYLSIFISYRKFPGDVSSKQVASIMNYKDSECVKCF